MTKELHYIDKQEKRVERKALKLYGHCVTANFYSAVIETSEDTITFDEKKLKQLKINYLLEMSKLKNREEE